MSNLAPSVMQVRVAKALVRVFQTFPPESPSVVRFDDWEPAMKDLWFRAANDAIEAMFDPTPEMLAAEMDLGGHGYHDGDCYCADPEEIYRAMMRAALDTPLPSS